MSEKHLTVGFDPPAEPDLAIMGQNVLLVPYSLYQSFLFGVGEIWERQHRHICRYTERQRANKLLPCLSRDFSRLEFGCPNAGHGCGNEILDAPGEVDVVAAFQVCPVLLRN